MYEHWKKFNAIPALRFNLTIKFPSAALQVVEIDTTIANPAFIILNSTRITVASTVIDATKAWLSLVLV